MMLGAVVPAVWFGVVVQPLKTDTNTASRDAADTRIRLIKTSEYESRARPPENHEQRGIPVAWKGGDSI